MLKRRTKKRRNPSMLEEIRERRLTGYNDLMYTIHSALKDGSPIDFINSMILYKRGHTCNDCDEKYYKCRCDDCEECGFVECLCSLNIKYKGEYPGDYTYSERKLIKEEAYKFLIYILNDDSYNDGMKYNFIPDNSKFKKLREEFLKNAINKSEIDLSRANLHGEDLSKVNLAGANLSGAKLNGACLSEANLSGANFRWSNLSGVDLSKANLSGATLIMANLTAVYASKADLSGADLSGADLSGADLSGANLHKTDFTNAVIKNTIFNNNPNSEHAINLIIPNPAKTLKKSYKNNKNFSLK